jgi:hypothetical protein
LRPYTACRVSKQNHWYVVEAGLSDWCKVESRKLMLVCVSSSREYTITGSRYCAKICGQCLKPLSESDIEAIENASKTLGAAERRAKAQVRSRKALQGSSVAECKFLRSTPACASLAMLSLKNYQSLTI